PGAAVESRYDHADRCVAHRHVVAVSPSAKQSQQEQRPGVARNVEYQHRKNEQEEIGFGEQLHHLKHVTLGSSTTHRPRQGQILQEGLKTDASGRVSRGSGTRMQRLLLRSMSPEMAPYRNWLRAEPRTARDGDVARKRTLLGPQTEGKKKTRQYGKVETTQG